MRMIGLAVAVGAVAAAAGSRRAAAGPRRRAQEQHGEQGHRGAIEQAGEGESGTAGHPYRLRVAAQDRMGA